MVREAIRVEEVEARGRMRGSRGKESGRVFEGVLMEGWCQ